MVEVRLEGVTKRFGKVVAVDRVNLVFGDGKFTALLGPSGSGKSTILYLVAGIYKPTEGRIYFGDKDVTDLMPNERNVGLVFQNYALYPHMTVYDNIAFPLKLRKTPPEVIRDKVFEVSKFLHISELLDRYPGQLSGGQQQRVALARALVKEPEVLLLDEPLSNLDALLRIRIRSELKRIQKELGVTAIYVTHDQSEALAMADTVVVINKGRIQQRGPPEKVYNEPRNVFVAGFIGSPPANIFTASMDYTEAPCINLPGGTRYCLDHSYSTFFNKSRVDRVIVGFRPEHAVISEHPVDGKVIIVGEVYTVEPLGRENIVTVASEEVLMKVITPPEVRPSIGDLVYVAIDEDKIMLFDPETEINIKYLVDGREGEDA
ncbi:MAG: ABC transporter ATP-binding protein [Desulfurococcales archaeon]|nr:ABC transporter ATP-binding protein [Desulfurococcales archaeon]